MGGLTEVAWADPDSASDALKKMLAEAQFDSFWVSSIEVALRFIRRVNSLESSVYVDVVFSCAAEVRAGDSLTGISEQDFFYGRSKFLADIYSFIGMDVEGVYLGAGGALLISIGKSVVELQLSQEDLEQDSSVWEVKVDVRKPHPLPFPASVACVATGGGEYVLTIAS
ncbi:hypothetical protein ACTT2I_02320 [Stenotrophomonas sp. PUT21]|uniref:hypothetical protein n=1 Tax=Stenotrophomonas TaxID=40323 RepID=UPI00117C78C4|nr:hypothetical protein [Stenotrophomonas maltophilia]